MAGVPAVSVEVVPTTSVDESLATLQSGKSQLVITLAETAYVGYRTSARNLGAPISKRLPSMFRPSSTCSSAAIFEISQQLHSFAASVSRSARRTDTLIWRHGLI